MQEATSPAGLLTALASETMKVDSRMGTAVDDVRYRLLGPMEVRVDGAPVKLPGTAERALLAQLLLSPGRTIPATMLVDRLWSESTLPVDPMNALQIRVSKLRRALKAMGVGDVVTREGVGYRASIDPSTVDALDFADRIRTARAAAANAADNGGIHPAHVQAYDDALALWRGDPLSDFATEQWATAEAARLTELRLAAMTERAQVALALGRHLEVVGDLEPVVARRPDPGVARRAADAGAVPQRPAGRRPRRVHPHPRGPRRVPRPRTVGVAAVAARAGAAPGRHPRRPAGHGPRRSVDSRRRRTVRRLSGGWPATVPVTMPAHRSRADEDRTAPTNLPTVVRPLIGRDAQLDSIAELLGGVRLLSLIGPGGAGKTSLALATVVRTLGELPRRRLRGAAGVGQHARPGAGRGRRRPRHADGRRRRDPRPPRPAHLVPGPAPACCCWSTTASTSSTPPPASSTTSSAAAPTSPSSPPAAKRSPSPTRCRSPSARWRRRRRTPRRARCSATRRRSCSPSGPAPCAPGCCSTPTTCPRSVPSPGPSTASRSPSSSPPPGCRRCRRSRSPNGSRTGSPCSPPAPAPPKHGSRRCAPPSTGATSCCSETERRVFDRLSVFQGGWTLMSAEEVVADEDARPGEVLDTVGRLVEQSMVVVEPGPTTRYRMLETLRQYAAERLQASGRAVEVARRHAAYFRGVVEHAEVALRGHEQRQTLRLLRDEQPNIRAALAFLSGPDGDRDAALRMAGSLGMFWHLGRHLEGRQVLSRLVAGHDGSPAARALALQAVSIVERPRGCLVHPNPRCAETAAESLALFEQLGDAWHAALSRVLLAVEGVTGAEPERSQALLAAAEEQFDRDGDPWGPAVIGFVRMETAIKTGDVDTAVRIGRTTAAAFRQLDDSWGLSATLYHLGWGLRQFGRFEEGARALEEAIDVARGAGLWNTAQWALADLAIEKVHLGDHDTARRLFDEAAAASREIGDGAGEVLAGYGYGLLAHVDGDWDEARRHYAIAVDGFIDLGTPVLEGVALAGLGRCHEADGDTAAAAGPVPGGAGTGPPARRTERDRVRPRRARTPRVGRR